MRNIPPIDDASSHGSDDAAFQDSLHAIIAKRNAAHKAAGSDPARRRLVARMMLLETYRELMVVQDLDPLLAPHAARVLEGVMRCLGLADPVLGPPAPDARAALSAAAAGLRRTAGGYQSTVVSLAPDDRLDLARRVRQPIIDRLVDWEQPYPSPYELATAVERGRIEALGAKTIFPNMAMDLPIDWEKDNAGLHARLAVWEQVIRANPRGRTDTANEYASRIVEKCSTAAGNPRGGDLFGKERPPTPK